MKDLARKIDSMRQFGYVLLTPKEAKRVAIELRRVDRLKKEANGLPDRFAAVWEDAYALGVKHCKQDRA